MSKENKDLQLIDQWTEKLSQSMLEQIELKLKSDPTLDVQSLKDEFLLNKLATVYIGAVGLGRQIKELEEKVNALQDKT